MVRLILLVLITLPLSGHTQEDTEYLIHKAFKQQFCFSYPPGWDTDAGNYQPGDATVILNECQNRETIRIDKAELVRPDDRGDACGTTRTCCQATDDDCGLDINDKYPTLYQSIKNNCEGRRACYINVPVHNADFLCGGFFFQCSTKTGPSLNITRSCFARRIVIYYVCITQPGQNPLPTGSTTLQEKTSVKLVTTNTAIPGRRNLTYDGAAAIFKFTIPGSRNRTSEGVAAEGETGTGLIVGVPLAALTLLIVVIIAVVMEICRSFRKCQRHPELPPHKDKISEPKYENVMQRQPKSLPLPVTEAITEEGTVRQQDHCYYNQNQTRKDTTGPQGTDYYNLKHTGQAQQALAENHTLEEENLPGV